MLIENDKSFFKKIYGNVFEANLNQQVEFPDIRTSGLPFCPIKYIFNLVDFKAKNRTSKNDFFFDFFCSVGTSVHCVFQRWIPIANPKLFFGNWKCTNKKCKFKKKYSIVESLTCPVCGYPLEYIELSFKNCFNNTVPISGHCDGIIIDPSFVENKQISFQDLNNLIKNKQQKVPCFIFELKTSSSNAISNMTQPYKHNYLQATFYANVFKEKLKKNTSLCVNGSVIVYVARDNPRLFKSFKIGIDKKFYKITRILINSVINYLETEKIGKYLKIKPCEKWTNYYEKERCEYLIECSETLKEDFKYLFKIACNVYKKNKTRVLKT